MTINKKIKQYITKVLGFSTEETFSQYKDDEIREVKRLKSLVNLKLKSQYFPIEKTTYIEYLQNLRIELLKKYN